MSHREMDQAADLHSRLAALEADVAAAKASVIVDLQVFVEVHRRRAELVAQIKSMEAEKS